MSVYYDTIYGKEVRTIVSGLVPYYTEEELLNKLVVVVTNLKPAKLRGIESNGIGQGSPDDPAQDILYWVREIWAQHGGYPAAL